MATFEIVRGEYGEAYRANLENVDLSDCTAKITVWNSKTGAKIIDGKDCETPVFDDPDTHVDFIPEQNDFLVDPFVYKALIVFTKSGVVKKTLPFTWEVFGGEP